MSADPPWLKWLAGVEEPYIARENAMVVLGKLAAEKAITFPGLEAFAIIRAEHERLPVREVLAEMMQGQAVADFETTSRLLATDQGTWWHAKMIDAMEMKRTLVVQLTKKEVVCRLEEDEDLVYK